MTTHSKAYTEGYAAAKAGMLPEACPYDLKSMDVSVMRDVIEWLTGYVEGVVGGMGKL